MRYSLHDRFFGWAGCVTWVLYSPMISRLLGWYSKSGRWSLQPVHFYTWRVPLFVSLFLCPLQNLLSVLHLVRYRWRFLSLDNISGCLHRRVNQNGGWNFKQPFWIPHFLPRSSPETNDRRFFANRHLRPVLSFVKVNVRHVASNAFAAFSQNVY